MTPEQETIAREVAALMKAARAGKGWTQDTAAKRLGIKRPTYANLEAGKTNVGHKFLVRLDNVYEAEADHLRQLHARFYSKKSVPPTDDVGNHLDVTSDITELFRRKRLVKPWLKGTWFAMWESTVDNVEVPNTEEIDVLWKSDVLHVRNLAPSPENPKGGYKWIAKMELFDNSHLLGSYIAEDADVLSKGTLFLTLHNSGRLMYGRWVGCNYDSEVATGATLFSRSMEGIADEFRRHCNLPNYPDPVPRENATDKGEIK